MRLRAISALLGGVLAVTGCDDEECSWVKTDQRVSGQGYTETSATLCGANHEAVCLVLSSPTALSLPVKLAAREGRAPLDSPIGVVTVERLVQTQCTQYATCLDLDATLQFSGDPEAITVHTHQYVHVEKGSCGSGYPGVPIPVE